MVDLYNGIGMRGQGIVIFEHALFFFLQFMVNGFVQYYENFEGIKKYYV